MVHMRLAGRVFMEIGTELGRDVEKDLRTLAWFIRIYCHSRHAAQAKSLVQLKTHDVQAIARKKIELCPECTKLLAHSFVKRSHCPMEPKPACKHCPSHCYHPAYRQQIREVMKYSGKRLLLSGRLDYLFHLLF
jgi:predicted amidophosphoribosyltransferase